MKTARAVSLVIAGIVVAFLGTAGKDDNQLAGYTDLKLDDDHKLQGYETLGHWTPAHADKEVFLHMKSGRADKVLSDIILCNLKPGDAKAAACPEGYTEVGHWEADSSTDATGAKGTGGVSLCAQYGTNAVFTVQVSKSVKGDSYAVKGSWSVEGTTYYLYTEKYAGYGGYPQRTGKPEKGGKSGKAEKAGMKTP